MLFWMFPLLLLTQPFWRSYILNKENKLPKITFWGKPNLHYVGHQITMEPSSYVLVADTNPSLLWESTAGLYQGPLWGPHPGLELLRSKRCWRKLISTLLTPRSIVVLWKTGNACVLCTGQRQDRPGLPLGLWFKSQEGHFHLNFTTEQLCLGPLT